MAKPNSYEQLIVQCSSNTYPVYIGSNLISNVELLTRHVSAQQVLVVTNETVAPLYLCRIQQALASFQCDVVVLKDGEEFKNEDSLFRIYDALINHHHHRDTTLIALGGGVIGDLTGFAAATYQRGVRFIQIPTTLLAQVDASIGGKTAINHPLAKNMIGSFHQPHAVIIDVDTLSTLPERELRAGLAEMIKAALLEGGAFLHRLQAALTEGLVHDSLKQFAVLIADSCQLKANVVKSDERETGQRALLNLGHTFAHALEACTRYQRWLHGEAVAIGLYCAALLSHQRGYLNLEDLMLVDSLLKSAKLPRRIPNDIDLAHLQTLMMNDKKIKNNRLCFVLIKAPGNCYLDDQITDDSLRHALMSAVEGD